jgi:long-chain acyl-CoA synthetase
MVIGSGRKFPAAICILSETGVKEWCSRHDIPYTTLAEMTRNEAVVNRVWKDVNEVNESFGKWEQVKKIIIDHEQFTVENGCLTPTFKVKRKPILEKYADQIETLYAE